MSFTVTKSNVNETKLLKNKDQDLRDATSSKNLDEVLDKVTTIDNACSLTKCKNKTHLFAIECKFCKGRFCTSHGLPEIHGCGEAVQREEKRKYMHPEPKLSQEKHSKAQTKLQQKLKQMQSERKSKQGFQNKGKKN